MENDRTVKVPCACTDSWACCEEGQTTRSLGASNSAPKFRSGTPQVLVGMCGTCRDLHIAKRCPCTPGAPCPTRAPGLQTPPHSHEHAHLPSREDVQEHHVQGMAVDVPLLHHTCLQTSQELRHLRGRVWTGGVACVARCQQSLPRGPSPTAWWFPAALQKPRSRPELCWPGTHDSACSRGVCGIRQAHTRSPGKSTPDRHHPLSCPRHRT